MKKLVLIAGQLNVEIKSQEIGVQADGKRIITDPQITIGGRAYRQAIFSKQLEMNIILLSTVGDDYYGKLIRESLEKAGISTHYIKEVPNNTTGFSIEISSKDHSPERYFSPGANLSDSEFEMPIDFYLDLCAAVVVNRWCSLNLRKRILEAAQVNAIPSVYVHSGLPDKDEEGLLVDYLFLDLSQEDPSVITSLNATNYLVQKGIFLYRGSEIIVLAPNGEERCRIANLPLEANGDLMIAQIIATLEPQIKLEDTVSFQNLML